MANNCMLTTKDNPFNPFEDFRSWFQFDVEKGYNSCSYFDRIAHFEDDMNQNEIDIETERAIDEIVSTNPIGIYIKVTNKDVKEPQPD